MNPELLARLLPFYCVLDKDLVVRGAGPSLAKVTGGDPVGRPWSDVVAGGVDSFRRDSTELLVAQARASGLSLRGQVVELPDGWLVAWSPWLASSEQFARSGLMLDDFAVSDPLIDLLHLMDAYERAQREAAEPLERIRRFFEVSPDLMLLTDMDGRILQANQRVADVMGVPSDRLTTLSLADLADPSALPVLGTAWDRLRSGEPVLGLEVTLRRPGDGASVATEWNAAADPAQGIVYATARDLSDGGRRLAANILESAPNPMMVIDPGARVFYANREARQLLPAPAPEPVGRPVAEVLPGLPHLPSADPDDAPVGLPGLVEAADRQFQVTAAPIVIDDLTHTLVSLDDVSARRRLEQELTAARDAAVALAQTRSDLLANTSHEIRTPLTAILGLADILLDTDLDDEQREVVATARVAGDRLLSLVNDFLSFAKGEARPLELDRITFSPAQLVEECARIVAQQAQERGNDVAVTVLPSTPPAVVGDREKLRTVVLNVLGNAVKFTHGGRVDLTVAAADDLVVTVADTGIGIPADRQESLFQPFAQGDASTTRQYGGSGLGLAISRQLVSAMAGTLSVESEPGRGSTFTIRVPMPPQAGAPGGAHPPATAAELAGLRVLLVEDDRLNSTLIIRMLERLGADVTLAADGEQCLAAYREHGPVWDVVLMDCHMPVMDGFAATHRLRAEGATSAAGTPLPVVALTASAMDDDVTRCYAAGMDGFIAKPVRLTDFPEHLTRYLPG